jgi:hypothetical protein
MAMISLPKGTMVEKINSEPGDSHPDGTRARVVGPLGMGWYSIEWADKPGTKWLIPETKIREVKGLKKKTQEG